MEQFGTSGVPIPCRMKPTYGGTLVFSCATIIQIHHLSVKFLNVSHCIRNFKEQFSTGGEKRSLYWLGHLGAIYQRVLEKILKTSLYTSRRNFQIRTLLNIFFDLFFQGVLCLNLTGWLFISQVVAGEKRLLSIALLRW